MIAALMEGAGGLMESRAECDEISKAEVKSRQG